MLGASTTLSQRIISAINDDVVFDVCKIGTFFSFAISRKSLSGVRFLQKITHGVSSVNICGYTSFFFLTLNCSMYVYSTKPIICVLVSAKCSKYPASCNAGLLMSGCRILIFDMSASGVRFVSLNFSIIFSMLTLDMTNLLSLI